MHAKLAAFHQIMCNDTQAFCIIFTDITQQKNNSPTRFVLHRQLGLYNVSIQSICQDST